MTARKTKVEPEIALFIEDLKATGDLDDAAIEQLESIFGKEKVAKVVKGGIHGTKRFNEIVNTHKQEHQRTIKELKDQADAEMRKLDSLRTTLAATGSTEKAKISQLESAIATIQNTLVERNSQIKRAVETARQYSRGDEFLEQAGLSNIDLNNLSTTPTKVEPKVEPTVNSNPSFTKEDIIKDVNNLFKANAQALARLPFDLLMFQQEYHNLTGKHLDPLDFYNKVNSAAEANNGQVDYHSIYLQEYGIEQLRKDKAEESIQARIEKEVSERVSQELSTRLMPGANQTTGKPSDFFASITSDIPKDDKELHNAPMGVNDPSTLVSEAVQDFLKNTKAA
jgi:hypothetical protein